MPAADGGTVELIAKAIDGQFPDYQRVIPSDLPYCATLDRAQLAAAIKRVAVLASDKSRIVKATFAGNLLTLSAALPEVGEASEDLACEYGGPEIVRGFDARYWRDALGALTSDTIAMGLSEDAAGPVRIAGWEDNAEVGALLQVLMPARV